jgi:hypothetical protein
MGNSIVALLVSSVYLLFFYIGCSQYWHVGYKVTESGLLTDNLKVYPKFRYSRQDPRNFMRKLRGFAALAAVAALFINPLLLVGAAAGLLMTLRPTWVDEGEKALECPVLWDGTNVNGERLTKVVTSRWRRVIFVRPESHRGWGPMYCTKANYDQVLAIVKAKLPNAEYAEETFFRRGAKVHERRYY